MSAPPPLIPLAETIRARRSIRRFRPEPLPDALLDELLDLAVEAPSSWNFQSRSVVAVTSPEGREALARAAGGQEQPRRAPVTLVFVAECEAWRHDLSDVYETALERGAWSPEFAEMTATAGIDFQRDLDARGLAREYAVKDAMLAASFAMLAAADAGLATSPMNGWDEAEVKKAIGADHRDDLAIALLLSIGYPAETRAHPGRRPRSHHVYAETHGTARTEGGRR
ncbi:nitroreductase [Nocardiopsis sp. Huas11]|uniref:nitroreductase family protein n=1 Tax=Nocardiopsis sp. Huas11 TaxID=2183912 RepID=UPI000EB41299|nr:nitroreductase family protein [Nocardiopsis sp. Huas11]RKS07339.1 nitroreductase [Nocardiopsis sp. Huas11]